MELPSFSKAGTESIAMDYNLPDEQPESRILSFRGVNEHPLERQPVTPSKHPNLFATAQEGQQKPVAPKVTPVKHPNIFEASSWQIQNVDDGFSIAVTTTKPYMYTYKK